MKAILHCLAGASASAKDTTRPTAAGPGGKAAAGANKGAKKRKQKQAKARNKRAAGAKYSTGDMLLLGLVCIGRSALMPSCVTHHFRLQACNIMQWAQGLDQA